ncbi:MAG TPA: hypothetical protein VMK12_01485 [Anaeromyxobacteraceae bacterium]|nr:hypothetical protein [Anaeromyxobacteraceae bacterium]
MIAEALACALTRAAEALEAGDSAAASAALTEAASACERAREQGLRLDPAQLSRLRALHARGKIAAGHAIARLAQAMEATASARRASTAYRRR